MEKIVLPKFGGDDFVVWRCQIEAFLAYHDLLEIVDGTSKCPEEDMKKITDWTKLDRKARLFIISALETNIVRQVMSFKTSHEVWSRLSALFELKDATTKQLALQRFFDYRMPEGSTIGQHVAQIEEMARQLEDLGEKQSDASLVTKTLHSLPPQYLHVAAAWDSMAAESQTMANLIPRLLKFEALSASMSGLSIDDNAAPAALYHKKTGSQQAKIIAKKSDGKQKSKKPKSKNEKKPFSGECFKCGKTGHRKAECPTLKSDGANVEASSMSSASGDMLMVSQDDKNLADVWLADTGASHHMTPRRELIRDFVTIDDDSVPITVGNKEVVYARGRGVIVADFEVGNKTMTHTLANVLYVPDLGKNLFGIGSSTDRGAVATFGKFEMTLKKGHRVLATGYRPGSGLYQMRMRAHWSAKANIANSKTVPVSVWHERFGHTNYRMINKLIRSDAVTGMEVASNSKIESNSVCEGCVLGKMSRKPFKELINRAKEPGELFHYEICGPMSIDGIDKSRMMAVFVDDYTGAVIVFPIRHKSEIIEKVEDIIAYAKSQGHVVKRLRSDNAKEFLSSDMKKMCRKNRIHHEHSTAYCPEQNGRVERQNRTIIEMARSMLAAADVPRTLWPEAVRTAAHIRNRVPLERLNGKTPYEAFTGRKPDVSHLRIFGSQAFMHIDKSQRQKLDNKSREVVLVGYAIEQKAYRVWERGTNKVHVSRDVIIAELKPKLIETISSDMEELNKDIEETPTKDNNGSDGSDESEPEEVCSKPMSKRNSRPVGAHERVQTRQMTNDLIANRTRNKYSLCVMIASAQTMMVEKIPETVNEAKKSPNAEHWKMAMADEIASLKKNQTWELVKLPKDRRAIKNKWIFRVKTKPDGSADRFKARLVIKGCSQRLGIDYEETFAPVARFESIRALLSVSAVKNFVIRQFDIKTAFLYGDLDEVIYMTQPEDFDDGSGRVCLLRKSLYGLKQAPKQWHKKFDDKLKSFGLTPTDYDPCVYANEDGSVLLGLYVDDGLVAGQSEDDVMKLLEKLKNEFEITHGEAKCYLGLEIERDLKLKTIRIHQSAYARSVLRKFGLDESNPLSTPSDIHTVLQRNEDEDGNLLEPADVPYREVIGSLMYLAVGTRPDIAFSVSNLSQFLSNPSEAHWKAAKRVLRYLRGTIELGIKFDGGGSDANQLIAYSDADWATCIDTRKSVSGVVLIFNGGPVIWMARKQSIVATSTAEAEYVAAHDAARKIVWMRGFLETIGVKQESQTTLFCDNTAAERLITNRVFHRRTKHIEIKFHYVRHAFENGQIDILHVASKKQLADIFTKALPRDQFVINRNALRIE